MKRSLPKDFVTQLIDDFILIKSDIMWELFYTIEWSFVPIKKKFSYKIVFLISLITV